MTLAGAAATTGGDFASTSPADVLRSLETRAASARIRFDARAGHGELDIVAGVIVDGFIGDLFGRRALLKFLALTEGHFDVSYEDLAPRPPLVASVAALLAEHAQRATKWKDLCDVAPPLSSVMQLSPAGREAVNKGDLPKDDRQLLGLVDGKQTLVDLIDEGQADAVESLAVLVEAVRRGWVVASSASAAPGATDAGYQGQAAPRKPLGLESGERGASVGAALRRKTVVGLGVPEPVRPRRAPVQRIIDVSGPRTPEAEGTNNRSSAGTVIGPNPIDAHAAPSAQQAQPSPTDDRRFIDRYEVLFRIGYGGMGSVHLCRLSNEGGFRRLFAIKVLRTHLIRNSTAATRFLDEARLAAHIHHPNVVPVFDAGLYRDQPYLVMDYVEGTSLRDLLAASADRRPPELIVPIVLDALAGLHAAHTLVSDDGTPFELVHCDVSPENLIVGVDGVCRLSDFGVARHGPMASERERVTHGKPAYLAPEQVLGHGVDRRADIFAMGALLYNALTGIRLFEGASVEDTLQRVCNQPIAPPSTVGLRPSPLFDFVCMRALEREATRRFSSAQEMGAELRRVALRAELISPTHQIAAWVRSVAGAELAQRRLAVLDASARPQRSQRPAGAPNQGARRPLERPSSDPPPNSAPGSNESRTIALPPLDEQQLFPTGEAAPRSSPLRTAALVVASVMAVVAVLVSLLWTKQVSRLLHLQTEAARDAPLVPTPPTMTAATPVPVPAPPTPTAASAAASALPPSPPVPTSAVPTSAAPAPPP